LGTRETIAAHAADFSTVLLKVAACTQPNDNVLVAYVNSKTAVYACGNKAILSAQSAHIPRGAIGGKAIHALPCSNYLFHQFTVVATNWRRPVQNNGLNVPQTLKF
jgi:hypothetical protein